MKRKTGTTRQKAKHFIDCCTSNNREVRPKVKARKPSAVYASSSSQIGKIGQLIKGQ